jgi:hypothetical protein
MKPGAFTDLSCEIRVFALRGKRSLSAAALIVFEWAQQLVTANVYHPFDKSSF